MLTKITLDSSLNLSKEVVGYIVKESSPISSGEHVPLYVPSIMSNIPKGEARTSIVSTMGASLFKNASACRPKVPSIITSANYINGVLENNSSIDPLLKDNKIPYNTKVNIEFYKGKLSKPRFNTDLV